MRRRLFWTINAVAALTGLLVLIGAAVATQRAAIDATQRELTKSSAEVVSVINDTVEAAERRPGAVIEIFRHLEGELGPVLGRIRRSAGSSDLAFAAVAPDGSIRTSADLFTRISVDPATVAPGASRFVTSSNDELVMLTATSLPVGSAEVTLVIALAREAPVVRLSDVGLGLAVVGLGMILISAALARLLSNQIVSRLEPLSGASRRLADGELSARVPSLGDPDLDQLGESFNEMASEIEATRDREREFILGVGHDLRTPLTTIAGYAEALEAEDLDPEDVARIGGVLGTQSRQLGRLIEDLSLLARLEQPEFSLRRERVDVGAHVAEIVDGFQQKAGQAGIKLHFEAEPGLLLDTDPDRLGQIAQNLVENALRYTPEAGQVSVTVESGEGSSAVISVADTGVGIESDDLPHIFDRHYVGRHRRIRNEGTGLGLSIVERLTERLGGDVVAESRPGKGTTITVRLPQESVGVPEVGLEPTRP